MTGGLTITKRAMRNAQETEESMKSRLRILECHGFKPERNPAGDIFIPYMTSKQARELEQDYQIFEGAQTDEDRANYIPNRLLSELRSGRVKSVIKDTMKYYGLTKKQMSEILGISFDKVKRLLRSDSAKNTDDKISAKIKSFLESKIDNSCLMNAQITTQEQVAENL